MLNNRLRSFYLFAFYFFIYGGVSTAQNNSAAVSYPKTTTASGLIFQTIKKGSEKHTQIGDKVVVNYIAKLENGHVFDNTVSRNSPITFRAGFQEVSRSIDEAVLLMCEGEKALIVVRPPLSNDVSIKMGLPENTTITFEIELISVDDAIRPYVTKGKDTITIVDELKYIPTNDKQQGETIQKGDIVTIHYTGYDSKGKWFISTLEKNTPVIVKVGKEELNKGLDIGITKMHLGEKARFIVPRSMTYQYQDTRNPSNFFFYDMEILAIKKPVKPVPFDTTGKPKHQTPSGLKYMVIDTGKGQQAETGKMVAVHYTGYYENGSIFDSSIQRISPFTFTPGEKKVIPGWEEAVLLMREGAKYRFIIPYNLAYGENGMGPVPPKTNLIFDMELLKVFP